MPTSKPEPMILPTMEKHVAERILAQADATVSMLNGLMRRPLTTIDGASGEIERNSPLFFGSGENPALF